MKVWIRAAWERLRASFWFVPALMIAIATASALAAIRVDHGSSGTWLHETGLIYAGDPEGAGTVLGAIAGSMATIAGVVFSLTLVALSLAASQYGPRLLRNFMRDTTNQFVLGIFISTFVFSLLVLRSIRHDTSDAFVPHLSVTLAVLLAVASLFVLIYFVHHVAVSIQADELVAGVGRELEAAIDRLFPARLGEGGEQPPATALPEGFERDARSIPAPRDGYVELIESDALLALACEHDLVLRIERPPGDYAVSGSPLVRAWPGERVGDELAARIAGQFVLGTQRTPAQDAEHAVHQIVEVALRALSPGMNDPFTALVCIDRLGSALCQLAGREMPAATRHGPDERLRVVAEPVDFARIADAALTQIRQSAGTSSVVLARLLETIGRVAQRVQRTEDARSLRAHAERIARCAAAISEQADRRAVEARYQEAMRVLENAKRGSLRAASA